MIHIADTKVERRYGDFFIRQIHKFEEVRPCWESNYDYSTSSLLLGADKCLVNSYQFVKLTASYVLFSLLVSQANKFPLKHFLLCENFSFRFTSVKLPVSEINYLSLSYPEKGLVLAGSQPSGLANQIQSWRSRQFEKNLFYCYCYYFYFYLRHFTSLWMYSKDGGHFLPKFFNPLFSINNNRSLVSVSVF